MTKNATIGLLLGAAVLVVAGCYDPYYDSDEYIAAGAVIEETPPPPLVEEIPPEPFVDAVWVPGYWSWGGSRYLWIHGRYMHPPRRGLVWYPGGYIRRGYGYSYVSGRWVSPGWRPRYHYIYGNIAFNPHYRSYYYYQPRGGYGYYGGVQRGYPYGYRYAPAPGVYGRGRVYGPGAPAGGYVAPGRPAVRGRGYAPPSGQAAPGQPVPVRPSVRVGGGRGRHR